MYAGVPAVLSKLRVPSGEDGVASPKSRIVKRPSGATRTFDGLRSRWSFPASWMACTPATSCATLAFQGRGRPNRPCRLGRGLRAPRGDTRRQDHTSTGRLCSAGSGRDSVPRRLRSYSALRLPHSLRQELAPAGRLTKFHEVIASFTPLRPAGAGRVLLMRTSPPGGRPLPPRARRAMRRLPPCEGSTDSLSPPPVQGIVFEVRSP